MSIFYQIFNNLPFNKQAIANPPVSNKIDSVPELNDIESLTDSSSYDGSGEDDEVNSETDINTLRMVEIMTEFQKGGNVTNDTYKESLENGELHQKLSSLRVVQKPYTATSIPNQHELHIAQNVVLETEPEKMIVNGTKVCKKKYGITKRNRYIHENMWSKSRV